MADLGWQLCEASRTNDLAGMRRLLAAGAHLQYRDWRDYTALHWAAYRGHLAAVRLLLEHGADLTARTGPGSYTALDLAAMQGRTETVQVLIAAGSDVTAADCNGLTALHWAARHGHSAGVSVLLAGGADPCAQNRYGDTALHWAISRGEYDAVPLLLISLPLTNKKGEMPADTIDPAKLGTSLNSWVLQSPYRQLQDKNHTLKVSGALLLSPDIAGSKKY